MTFLAAWTVVLLLTGHAAATVTDLQRIHITDVRLVGPQILDPVETDAVIAPYRDSDVTFEELMVLRQRLTELLVKHGYVNSGIVVPNQRIESGVVEMRIVAGTLATIEISGDARLSDSRIAKTINSGVSQPLNINDLAAMIEKLQRDPLVDHVNAYVGPGTALGEGVLSLDVHGAPTRTLQVVGNNYSPPGIDEHQVSLRFIDASLTGRGDTLTAILDATDGSKDNYIGYSWRFSGGSSVLAYYSDEDLKIVEEPFDDLDIRTHTKAWGVLYNWPVIDAATRSLSVFVGFENERSKSRLLGVPFSFSLGEDNGRSATSAVSIGAEWAARIGTNRFALRGTLTRGVDVLHATTNSGNIPDTNFTLFIGQGQYLRDLPWLPAVLSTRITIQLVNEALLPQLKLPVGGRYSVRGYRENQLVRDNGLYGSVELRIPIDAAGNWTFIPFCDYGRSWDENQDLPTANAKIIYSVGAGMTWTGVKGLDAELFYGDSLRDIHNPTETNQDRGWNYQLSYSYQF